MILAFKFLWWIRQMAHIQSLFLNLEHLTLYYSSCCLWLCFHWNSRTSKLGRISSNLAVLCFINLYYLFACYNIIVNAFTESIWVLQIQCVNKIQESKNRLTMIIWKMQCEESVFCKTSEIVSFLFLCDI